jgi:hypothetical protein
MVPRGGCRQVQQLKQNKDLILSGSTLAAKILCVATLCVAMQFRQTYVALQHGDGRAEDGNCDDTGFVAIELKNAFPRRPGSSKKEVKDRIVKTAKRIVTAALGGALCLATSMGLSAAASRSPTTMKPLMATSLDVGSKHVVSYFLNADGQCKLTLMIADAARDENSEPSAQILRLRLMVEPGRAALVDTTDGRLVQFACERDAQAMNATLPDQIAAGHDIK